MAPLSLRNCGTRRIINFSVHQQDWPVFDGELAHMETLEIPVQVNGKTRGTIRADVHTPEAEALKNVAETPDIQKYLKDQNIARVVYVPGKILNVVTK